MQSSYEVIRTISITEKSNDLMEHDQYTFVVDPRATKPEIRAAVEELFDRKVAKVRTINVRGKQRRTRFGVGHTPAWKKAIVTLQEDEEPIEFF